MRLTDGAGDRVARGSKVGIEGRIDNQRQGSTSTAGDSRGIGCSNGMAFSPDRKRFYYTDSFAHSIYSFDYCVDDGTLSNQAVFATFADADGMPDGATMDADGCLWSALWDGASIVRLTPAGRIDARIVFPVPKTSSLAFGGEGYADIYITTAGGNAKPEEGDLAGALFRVRTGVRGTPEFLSRVA